jgi:tRNA-specific 2-thiouridylase
VPDGDVRTFVRGRRPDAFVAGEVLDATGAVVGSHDGVPGITVGQRRGLGLAGGERRFVTSVDAALATLTVGARTATTSHVVRASDAVWRGGAGDVRVTARVRYRGPEPAATACLSGDRLVVTFDEAVDAAAPGQALVCYDGERVLGGGVVEETS